MKFAGSDLACQGVKRGHSRALGLEQQIENFRQRRLHGANLPAAATGRKHGFSRFSARFLRGRFTFVLNRASAR
jgi:hypothetical protein